MSSTVERLDFHPPHPQPSGSAYAFALAVHLLLVMALSWGVNWTRPADPSVVEAEVWSDLPQQAVARSIQAPPTPANAPAPEAAGLVAPDIAVGKASPRAKPDTDSQSKTQPERQGNTPTDKRLQSTDQGLERQRALNRALELARAEGASTSSAAGARNSGPSIGYQDLVKNRVKPNMAFAGSISGNPMVTVEIRMASDGTIMLPVKPSRSSGDRDFDQAVVRAIEKTQVLPLDGGKVWSPLVIEWRYKD